MKPISKNTIISLSDDISWQEYFGKIYVIKESNNKIYTLTDEMVAFWNVMQEHVISYDNLLFECLNLMKEYDKTSVEDNLKEFLMQLYNFKIIEME